MGGRRALAGVEEVAVWLSVGRAFRRRDGRVQQCGKGWNDAEEHVDQDRRDVPSRSAPGTPMWHRSADGMSRNDLILNLQRAERRVG